jgi:uncharacterized membrane protein YphA (DoxX/SURF4 family)
MKWLAKYTDHAYALMRIMAGFMFSFHGAQKILGVLSEFQPAMGSQLWFGGMIELLGGLAVMLGFGTPSPLSCAAARWPLLISSSTGNSRWDLNSFRR